MARVAFILDELFEDSEFQVPYDRVRDAGHEPVIVGLQAGKKVTGKNGAPVTIERGIDEVGADEFDALVIPGGYSPDKIRTSPGMSCRRICGWAPTSLWCRIVSGRLISAFATGRPCGQNLCSGDRAACAPA